MTQVQDLLYFCFRFLGKNRIKEIAEMAFENMKSLKTMYVRIRS